MHVLRTVLVLVLVVLTAASGACVRSSDSAAASSATGESKPAGAEVCALLTSDDVRTVTGVEPGAPKFESSQCIWSAADGSNEFLVQLMATPTLVRSWEDLAEHYQEFLDADVSTAVHRIEDGDDLTVGFKGMPMVQIFTRSMMVQVSTSGHQEKHALELARRAAGRLRERPAR